MSSEAVFRSRGLVWVLSLFLVLGASIGVAGPAAAQDDVVSVSGAFETEGDAADADVNFRWLVPDEAVHWHIEVEGSPERSIWVVLLAPDGERIEQTSAAGVVVLADLALDPAEYTIVVPRISGDDSSYRIRVTADEPVFDAEPNDRPEWAIPIDDGVTTTGRLARSGRDEDLFELRVAPGDERLRDVHLRSTSEKDRELCLLDADAAALQCRRAVGDVALRDLGLRPGTYRLLVRGSSDADGGYELEIDASSDRRDGYEVEPNDTFVTASLFDAATGVSGRSATDDWDFHRLVIEGEPQLWQIVATGTELDRLSLVNGSGDELITSTPRGDRTWAELNDAYLVPGTHRLKVRARGGPYQIVMTALGPRDEDMEREPNSDDVHAEPYAIGELRRGRLATDEDIDLYRFTLGADAHISLDLTQPADADLEVRLETGHEEILRQRGPEAGKPIELDLLLGAGDYLLTARAITPSAGTYEMDSTRLSTVRLAVDQEPNDEVWLARPVPPSLAWSGSGPGSRSESDTFLLPPLSAAATISVHHSDARPSVRLFSDGGATRLDTRLVEDGLIVAEDVPAGEPLVLQLQAIGPYDVRLESAGWEPVRDPVRPALDIDVTTDVAAVAAYWPEGQQVDGVATITNLGQEPVSLDLSAQSSHYAWLPALEVTSLDLSAGTSTDVPLTVTVHPDVWADAPVDIEIIATTAEGIGSSGRAVLDARPGVAPIAPFVGWTVPDALLGGLNVAGAALGGEPGGTIDASREILLYDDVTPARSGFVKNVGDPPIDLIVDLAGDSPVSIAGTILNPLAGSSRVSATPRDFELLLSIDGSTWTSVLTGVLSSLPIDQAFVLDTPVPATHAMLRVLSFHNGGRNAMELGEWKVVAEPGTTPDPMPSNIAAPGRGGHLVRHEPFLNSFAQWRDVLDEDPKRQTGSIARDSEGSFELVVGFQDGRAARIDSLRWHDPDGSDPAVRLDKVSVEVGTQGPLGPWTAVGDWALERAADGSVMPFELIDAPWARYLRLTSPFPLDARQVEMPAPLEVLEHPTSDGYRSILGEWGYAVSAGPFEWLTAIPSGEVAPGPDAGDTLATATALEADVIRADQVEILEDDDWYLVEVPAGHNTLTVDIGGIPIATASLSLFEPTGEPVPADFELRPGGEARHVAAVDPGRYALKVEQPPFNLAFTYDTSGSMGPFLDFVLEGMRAFASDVAPGREAATIVPFGREPLLESFSDQPAVLEDAVNNYIPANDSSAAEDGLLRSAMALRDREGAKAILIVTDAETGSLQLGPEVWAAFDGLRPTVYAVHVGGATEPEATRNLMRGWADANGGHYDYPTTHAAMERAFERMSTRLRRPADYTIIAGSSFVDRSPALLTVTSPPDQPAVLAPGIGVEIILDTSGSMRKKLDGERRIDIARASLRRLVSDTLEDGVPVAIRTFGGGKGKAARCRTRLSLPLAPLEGKAATRLIRKLDAERKTKTPLAESIAAVADDLASVEGSRTVVLVTDGAETCGGDPEAEILALRDAGIEVNLNIVGFALEDEELKAAMARWAEVGAGSYFDAGSADELAAAITTAVAAPYRVFEVGADADADADADAEPVASSTVNGLGVVLEPGFYRVEVLTDPIHIFEDVEVLGGSDVALDLPAADGADDA